MRRTESSGGGGALDFFPAVLVSTSGEGEVMPPVMKMRNASLTPCHMPNHLEGWSAVTRPRMCSFMEVAARLNAVAETPSWEICSSRCLALGDVVGGVSPRGDAEPWAKGRCDPLITSPSMRCNQLIIAASSLASRVSALRVDLPTLTWTPEDLRGMSLATCVLLHYVRLPLGVC